MLAKGMTNLPEQKVARVLKGNWGRWVNWRTTDAQLAAALGIPTPSLRAVLRTLHPRGAGPTAPPPSNEQSPLCTT